ncbi:alpha/beta fold hydrolase [Mycobacterium sp. E2733]|uniref:alpha/beta fold hydrolase n=1 Tax=Mycobacterium sp. E2733 TaxID=1834138 RepID=UPI0018D2E348|nr:alpha/beta hydrolase [Mycobacterium sp. E2733]
MSDTSPSRIRLSHHVVELDDGRRIGLSVGGRGVPLLFMHGLLLSRRAYLRMLSRIAGMGFLVVAVDAAGHGDTGRLPSDACAFTDRADSVLRTLDALGIGQALFVGHSMGGRMTIQLAARAPERVLAAVLFDPAAGGRFDTTIPKLAKSPAKALGAAYTAVRDTLGDPTHLTPGEQLGYFRVLAAVAVPNLRNPLGAVRTIKAIVESGDYTPMLHTMRDEGMPTMVVHAEKDLIVPFQHARDIADESDATLYMVPDAYHSWMIANPRQGADAFRQLLDGELGEVLRNAADTMGIADVDDHEAWERELLDPDALVLQFIHGRDRIEIGAEELDPVELELVRRTERSQERMSWARRKYRRWAAKHLHQARSLIRQNTRIEPDHRD